MGQPKPLFVYFRSFQTQIGQKKITDFSGIRTCIDEVEGKHAEHLTITSAHEYKKFIVLILQVQIHGTPNQYSVSNVSRIFVVKAL